MPIQNFSIGYQNIEGLHSSLFGCKLNLTDFKCDIEILAETWTSCESCKICHVPDYQLIKSIEPEKRGNRGRSSGGLLIFCKERLKRKIKILESADKYTWLELDKSLFLSQKTIKVCAIYSQPSLSNYYRDSIWEDLETSIIGFSDETSFCIIGDMNGRTGTRPDFEENRNDKHVRCIPSNVTKKARKNCDETMNRVGEIILELCRSYDLQIANGRTRGDILGNFTHFNKNTEQSAVDIALVSDSMYYTLEDFMVLPQDFFSDHSKIVLTIKNIKELQNYENYNWQKLRKTY